MPKNPLLRLNELGQSPWLDYITRDLISSGELERLIAEDGLRGMTTNPTIFQKAVAGSEQYDADIERLARAGKSAAEIFETIAVADVRNACDAFAPIHEATGGVDGKVSIEVAPALARDTRRTIDEAHRLWSAVGRPNVMIKIPGTREGLPAIRACIADGINVNVTLLFSVDRYREVIDAYWSGLEARAGDGQPVDRIASVASFFVSRVDTKVDGLLDDRDGGDSIRGKIAIANACMAYAEFRRAVRSDRWRALQARGGQRQRPLWASTSTKDPRYPDVYYVEALIAPDTVNTVPPVTLDAYRDHGRPEVRIDAGIAAAPGHLMTLAEIGIELGQVTDELEEEGIRKFADSYDALLAEIETKAAALKAAERA